MKHGNSRVGLRAGAAGAALAVLGLLFGPWAASPAYAQKPTPASAKPKNKKPKAGGKGAPHGAGARKGSAGPGGGGAGKAAPGVAGAAVEVRLPIQRVTLENGLRVVMSVDRTSPTVALSVAYDVGSRNERPGQSGLARVLSGVMFRGSANVRSGEHARLVASHGGRAEGRAGTDVTAFTEVLPSSELALGLWLEADRMRSLDVSAEGVEAERAVAQEEAQSRLLSAEGAGAARGKELIYQGYWAYEHPEGGRPEDLDAVKPEAVRALQLARYAPNNAAIAIAGDFDPDEAMGLVHKHFDAIPRAQTSAFDDPGLPEQTAQRTAVVQSGQAKAPEVRYGWAIPPSRHADRAAVELAALVVAEGEGSRLYQVLVHDKRVAEDVRAVLSPMSRGPGSLMIVAQLSEGAKVGDVEKLIEGELRRLGLTPPSEGEMQKARRRAQARLIVDGLSTLSARADRLAAYEVMFGSALHMNEDLPKIGASSAEDVRRAAAQYLGPTRRTIVETYPVSFDLAGGAKPAAAPPLATGPAGLSGHAARDGGKTTSSGRAKLESKKGGAKKGGAKKGGAKKKAASGAKLKKSKKQ